jgi:diacylglycerol kinase (ATP)
MMLKNRIRSLGHAVHGIVFCTSNEVNFGIEVMAAVVVIFAGTALGLSATEWLCIIGCITVVLVAEVLNTAAEKICDLYSTSQHPQIKIIKNVAAAAVLIAVCGSIASGLIIFLPKFTTILKNNF